jgi:hypothetical protein
MANNEFDEADVPAVIGHGMGSDLTSSGVSLDAWGNVIEDTSGDYETGDQHPAALGMANNPATGDVNAVDTSLQGRTVDPRGGAAALGPDGRPAADEDDYNNWTVADLDSELRDRSLSTSGNKADKVARLEANDEADGNSPQV